MTIFFKKIIFVSLSLLACAGVVSANYEDFTASLSAVKVDVQSIVQAPVVSRDELAQLLNYVDCHDCHRPGADMIGRLTSSRWNTFRLSPTANFDDINYNASLTDQNNYYCIAYTAEQGYMSGYPRQTSPLCSGKFCAANNTTVADFLQVIINILSDRIASHYQINRQNVAAWMQSPEHATLIQRYFTLAEQGVVYKNASQSTDSVSLQSKDEFTIYLKYCTFNLSSCGMQEWKSAKQNFWPVAELNVLVLEGIVTDNDANSINVSSYVDGKTVLESLSRVKEKVACTITTDQDHDGISDYTDNCYLAYNPSQKDTNNNGIGDVCDSDIDGDGVKNPVGIVDDKGNIDGKVVQNFTGKIDNCLDVANVDQKDTNNDGIGDACSDSEYFGLSIITRKIKNGTYALAANYTGNLHDFAWDFGDGTYGQGKATSHTFPGPGIYAVVLTAQGGTRTYIATTTISVAIAIQPTIGFQITPNPLAARAPSSINVTPETTRPVDSIVRQTNNQTKTGADSQRMAFLYEKQGNYPIIAKAYNGTQIVAYAQASVSLDGSIGSYLKASNISPKQNEQITFTTTTAGIEKKDIVAITRDFGDGNTQSNTSLIQPYAYAKSGPKIVTQTIYLLDGTTMVNIINIDVTATENSADQGVDLLPEKLVMHTGEPVRYRFVLNGIVWDDVSRIIVDMSDGQQLGFSGALQNGFVYTYRDPGIYRVMARVQKTDGLRFYPAAQITVIGTSMCLLKNSAANTNSCDMDKDGVADICDDDINGDGMKNLLGLIVTEPKDCKYDDTDLDTKIVDETIDRIGSGDTTLDKCPVSKISDQKDTNGNFIGDSCEDIIKKSTDSDGDGIDDTKDACPDAPENFNGIDDTDGCPDFPTIVVDDIDPGVKAVQCNACPCPYVQDAADIKAGDKIRAVLMNSGSSTPLSTSSPYIVN